MKISIKKNILMEHLNYVIKGVSSKNLIPILNCIKFELTKEGLYLLSTDNEIAIKTFIDKSEIEKIDESGDLVLSGRYIYDIIRKLPNEIINIEELIDSKVNISTSNSSFNLNCNNASDFPKLELEDNKNPIIINKKIFKNIVNQTIFATSNQESRPVLTGINFNIVDNVLECTATDSYRLSKKIVILNEKVEEKINIIIPSKNLQEIIKLFNEEEDNVELHIFSNKVIFKFNTINIMSRIINGTYPDTKSLIPKEFLLKIKVRLEDFYDAIDRASLLTSESDKNTIKLESKNNLLVISSNIPEIGNVEEKILCKKDNKEEIKISFSSKYMMDALKALECEEIFLMFNGEIKPIIVKNIESEDIIQLILPIRTY
jgi:DNA polymerase-3 subunit beta